MSKNNTERIHRIDIGNDFAKHLGGRYKKDSEKSGEEFLETILEPAFLEYDKIVIHLDSLEGYSAGFMEEAFGGLARKYGYETASKKIDFETEKRPYLKKQVLKWMEEAR